MVRKKRSLWTFKYKPKGEKAYRKVLYMSEKKTKLKPLARQVRNDMKRFHGGVTIKFYKRRFQTYYRRQGRPAIV